MREVTVDKTAEGKRLDRWLKQNCRNLPMGLMQMLNTGGMIVIPIGPEGSQKMHRITKNGETQDEWLDETLGDAYFVPMLEGRNFTK